MTRVRLNDQEMFNFLVAQTTYIEAEVVRIKYPELQYRDLVPVDTSAPPWAKSITYFSVDRTGRADWYDGMAGDVPIADINRNKHEQGVEMAAIGYRYTEEELGFAMMTPGLNLSAERAAAATRAAEEFVDRIVRIGDTAKGIYGMLNSPAVPKVTAATVSGQTTWAQKAAASLPDAIIADVNGALGAVWTGSLSAEMANTVLLPLGQMQTLSNTRLPNTGMSALQFLLANNTWTNLTGQPLMMRAVLGLDTAGTGSTGRMIAYRRDPQVVKFHYPMPHQFRDVWRTNPLTYDVPGIMRVASVEWRRPNAAIYVDGI